MKKHWRKPHNLSQLHDEILLVYPDLKGVIVVEGKNNDIYLDFPDGYEGLIDPIVKSHVPSPQNIIRNLTRDEILDVMIKNYLVLDSNVRLKL